MIVCYDNTVNRQKLADVDCSLDTVGIPNGSERERDVAGLNAGRTKTRRPPAHDMCKNTTTNLPFILCFINCSFSHDTLCLPRPVCVNPELSEERLKETHIYTY